MIAPDYASLFLWSPSSFYAYNKEYIFLDSKSALQPTETFFDNPHNPKQWNVYD